MARSKKKEIFRYECTLTGETYKTTKKAKHPDELISVAGYYELNPEKDDRPEHIKKEIEENN
ncbi:hypothetical protein BIY24_07015 [Halobacteriovorax marinus]|uniref:hypothetical protein n=1 Tax=Halobacteriovorax marinus TaxID=97084 RepID=UPI00031D426A|nr:hypothetical protein [Halobacteriovorax marinus]ATH07703.1 hypothetical protein BIY24_07015 [Halobacteriovorax marinus]